MTAVLLVLLVLPFVLRATRHPAVAGERGRRSALGEWLAGFWISPRRYPDFAWAWLTRFLVQLGNAMATLYLLYFLQDEVRTPSPEQGQPVLIALYTVGHDAHDGGVRRAVRPHPAGARSYVIAATCVMAVAAVLLAFFPVCPAAMVAAAHPRARLRHLPLGRPGPDHPGAAGGRGPRPRPRRHQHRQLRPAGARPGDRRPDRHQRWRLHGPVPADRRRHAAVAVLVTRIRSVP